MARWIGRVQSLADHQEGAVVVEYALMVALIALICISAVVLAGGGLIRVFALVEKGLPG